MSTAAAACSRCGHADDKHRNNKCHHLDTWLGLYKREYRECACWMSDADDASLARSGTRTLAVMHDFLDAKMKQANDHIRDSASEGV